MSASLYKFLTVFGLILIIFASFFTSASAHIYVADQGVQAVLHIDPGDSPIVGEPAELHFDFNGTQEKLDLTTCNCMVTVAENGNVLFGKNTSDALFKKTPSSLALSYIFPQKDVFVVMVHGTTDAGRSFMLSYNVRVDRDDRGTTVNSISNIFLFLFSHHGVHALIILGALVVGIWLTWLDKRKEARINNNKK